MEHASRWMVGVAAASVAFALSWWLAEDKLDTQSSIGVATVVATVVLTPLGFWASRQKQQPPTAPTWWSTPPPPPSAAAAVPSISSPGLATLPPSSSAPVPAHPTGPIAPPPIVVGDIPGEAVAWQERDVLLDRLRTVAAGGRPAIVCAVTGQRGIGKTQLAAAYARQRCADGWPVAWVSAETELSLLTGLDRLAAAVGCRPPDADLHDSAEAALSWMKAQSQRCLLIYDNALDPDLIRRWTPSVGAVQTIVTTTDRRFDTVGVPIEVGVFTETEAATYLRERTGLIDDSGASRVAHQLGWLPVALSQAAAVIGRGRRYATYQLYLERLDELPIDELLPRAAGDPYPLGAAEAILISLEDLDTADPDRNTRQLLNRLAVLAPTGADPVLLHHLATISRPRRGRWRRKRLSGGPDASVLVAALAQRSLTLLALETDRIVLHRLIQRVVRDRIRKIGELDAAVIAATDAVRAAARQAGQEWSERARVTDYAEHARVLLSHPAGSAARKHCMRLAKTVLYLLNQAHSFFPAVTLGPAWVAACERVLGPDDPDTLASRNNLAFAYRAVGRLEEAVVLYTRTLADRERLLGPDHPDTLGSRNNLATAYRTVGRLEEAVDLYTRTLADRERLLGPDHPDTLASRNNLASAYRAVGRLEEAVDLYTRTLADRGRVLGPDHPDTLVSRNNLAETYREVGRLEEAVDLYTRTIADCERVLGPDHPDTLSLRNNLAVVCQAVGRLEESVDLCARTVADCERVLGPDHPDTLGSRNNLAAAYWAVGRLEESVDLCARTLADYERVLGAHHQSTVTARENLAHAREALRKARETEA